MSKITLTGDKYTKMNILQRNYAITLVSISIAWAITMILAYFYYANVILQTIATVEGIEIILLIMSIRIGVMGILTAIIFYMWLKQEASYTGDIPFLMGIFFITITFGKPLDLLQNLVTLNIPESEALILLKLRYIIIIITAIPLLYLGLGLFLYNRGKTEEEISKIRTTILAIIVSAEVIALLIAPDLYTVGILLPFILLPALVFIVWIFIIAYKAERLNQVNPGILVVGFIMYIISNIMRPVFHSIYGMSPIYIVYSETLDLLVFAVLFTGIVLKRK